MNELSEMTPGELEEYLSKLRADLEEIEEERMFVLGQTGLHLSASEVGKYEADVNRLKARIEEAEQAAGAKRAD